MRFLVTVLLFTMLFGSVNVVFAKGSESLQSTPLAVTSVSSDSLADHFSFTLRDLAYVVAQKPANDVIPANFLEIPRIVIQNDLRPDFAFNYSRLHASVKPRFDYSWQRCEDGVCDGHEDTDDDFYVNEWLVRLQPIDSVFVSYGRENLQWGPSFLLSPSNPFYAHNGKSTPKKEVPGADYARLVWSPNMQWTGSIIVNTDEGRQEREEDFCTIYALKLDHTLDRGNYSLILAQEADTKDTHVGFYGSWNASDAVVLYTEDSLREGDVEALVGSSYTFNNGSMVSLEYFRNEAGEAHKDLLDIYFDKGMHLDTRMVLNRKNYLMLQYYYQDDFGRWNATLRGTSNLDDHSTSVLGHVEYNIGSHFQLFSTGTLFTGNDEGELRAVLDYHAMAGVEFTY